MTGLGMRLALDDFFSRLHIPQLLIPRVDRQFESTGRLDAFDLPLISEGASILYPDPFRAQEALSFIGKPVLFSLSVR
ncbi:hypothetical protein NXS19_008905 [Fusarium pseudograminearum]|nr:hypothetical protein NXS19_008905 [Fusarium pseudograminearum]